MSNGDVSDSSDINSPLQDIEADLNVARPVVAGGTGATTAADARTNLGLAIGTDVQAYDADLAGIAALGYTSGSYLIKKTAAGTYSLISITAAGEAILDDADASAQRTTLGLAIGTNVQAYDAALGSLAGLSFSAGDTMYATGADTLARLAIGTAGQVLTVNSGATAPEWATPVTPVKAWADFSSTTASGTYSRSGTLVTVTITSHGMVTGQGVDLDFTTGTATDGYYTVTVVDANTFTVTDSASGATSGNVTRNIWVRASFGIASIRRDGSGDQTATWSAAFASDRYMAMPSHQSTSNGAALTRFVSQTAAAYRWVTTDAGGAPISAPHGKLIVCA